MTQLYHAYNTPEHKFNIGVSGKDINFNNLKNIGFNINYKWIEGFIFEGSPQFTGLVPSYGLLDLQVTKVLASLSIKLGGSNILNNKVLQVYGGPYIGRMVYLSLLLDI